MLTEAMVVTMVSRYTKLYSLFQYYSLSSGGYLCSIALLSSRLLSKNLKIKIYRTIILPVVLYGCETWSSTLREEGS